MHDAKLFEGMDAVSEVRVEERENSRPDPRAGAPRLLRPDRTQIRMEAVSLDARLAADHRARVVWAAVKRLDLSRFYEPIKARDGEAGRTAIDPQLLVALWLYACIEGVGSGRRLARLCESEDAYRWLCGGVSVCYHTLNDFRVSHEQALDELLTQVVGRLTYAGIVTAVQVAQDGTRVRASAGKSSFRREPTLRKSLEQARKRVESLKKQRDDSDDDDRGHALRAAEEQQKRLEAALAELPKVEALKQSGRTDRPSRSAPARVSTTDPEARKMRMGDGSWHPAYNVQLAADTGSRAITGVMVTNSGTDSGLSEPMRLQVEKRTGLSVAEHLTDGGYTLMEDVQRAWEAGATVYRPPPAPQGRRTSPYEPTAKDTPEQAMWRELMGTPEAQAVYRIRASVIETINGDLKQHRGLRQFSVRGLTKTTCVALWTALAYNILHFGETLAAT